LKSSSLLCSISPPREKQIRKLFAANCAALTFAQVLLRYCQTRKVALHDTNKKKKEPNWIIIKGHEKRALKGFKKKLINVLIYCFLASK